MIITLFAYSNILHLGSSISSNSSVKLGLIEALIVIHPLGTLLLTEIFPLEAVADCQHVI